MKQRPNLTYICFGQTGSGQSEILSSGRCGMILCLPGKSHTIFGSKANDGLLVHCTQFLLREMNAQSDLICSFYEIYNNQVYDLNNPGKKFVQEQSLRQDKSFVLADCLSVKMAIVMSMLLA